MGDQAIVYIWSQQVSLTRKLRQRNSLNHEIYYLQFNEQSYEHGFIFFVYIYECSHPENAHSNDKRRSLVANEPEKTTIIIDHISYQKMRKKQL
jgi:hypothetical protein